MENVIRRMVRQFSLSAIVIAMASTSLSAWSQQAGVATAFSRWVATWTAAPMAPGSALEAPQTFENQTVRHVVHVSVGGQRIRVRLSNAYGAAPLVIGAAHVALHADGASILAGSDRTLTFSGQTSISIPTGAVALSDPVVLNVPSLADLAVSIFVPNNTGPATYHESSDQTAYISGPGDFTSALVFPTAATSLSRFWLVGVEAEPLFKVGAVVAIGDSITTSFRSTVDANRRWTDDLAARLDSPGEPPRLADVAELAGTEPVDVVRLLPAFDQWVVCASRRVAALSDPQFHRRIYRPQGWVSPVLLVNGHISGIWKHEVKGRTVSIKIEPFANLPRWAGTHIAEEAERLAAFFGGNLELSIHR